MKLVPSNINEAIKHLAPYTDAEVNEKLAKKVRSLYDWLKRRDELLDYTLFLEDDDTCIMLEKNGEMKFRIYLFPQFSHTIDYSIYVYKNGIFQRAYAAGNEKDVLAVIRRSEDLKESIKHLPGVSQEEIMARLKELPMHEQFPFVNDQKIKLDPNVEEEMKRKIRKEAYRLNKLANLEIDNLNLSFNMNLPRTENKDLVMLTSQFSTYFVPKTMVDKGFIIRYKPEETGVLQSIFTDIKLEFSVNIIPEDGFTFLLNYDWHMLYGSNGKRLNLSFDNKGNMINCPWKYHTQGKNKIYSQDI